MASCTKTKKLLKHCSCCREEGWCPVNHCSVSRTLLKHWGFCKVFYCPLCTSVRHYDLLKSSIMGSRRDVNYSTNSNEAKFYATSLVNSSMNVVNTTTTATTTNRGAGFITRIGSTSACSEEQMKTNASSKSVIIPPRPFPFHDKINSSEVNRCILQENKTKIAPSVYSTWSNFSQAKWEPPLCGNDLGEDLHQISWTMTLEQDYQHLSANATEPISELFEVMNNFEFIICLYT